MRVISAAILIQCRETGVSPFFHRASNDWGQCHNCASDRKRSHPHCSRKTARYGVKKRNTTGAKSAERFASIPRIVNPRGFILSFSLPLAPHILSVRRVAQDSHADRWSGGRKAPSPRLLNRTRAIQFPAYSAANYIIPAARENLPIYTEWHGKRITFSRVKKKARRLRANEFVVLHRDLPGEISPPAALAHAEWL